MVRIRPTHLIVGVLVGIGFVELWMTGLLVAFGGDHTAVVAGVLLERALTFLPPIAEATSRQAASRRRRGALARPRRRAHGSPALSPADTAPAAG